MSSFSQHLKKVTRMTTHISEPLRTGQHHATTMLELLQK